MSRLTTVPAAPDGVFSRLVADYLQDRRAGGVSPKTVAIYADALNGVLLTFCATHDVTESWPLTNRLLNGLGGGLLDGTLSRRGRPPSKATLHRYTRAVNTVLE
jgi:hypothetical protein